MMYWRSTVVVLAFSVVICILFINFHTPAYGHCELKSVKRCEQIEFNHRGTTQIIEQCSEQHLNWENLWNGPCQITFENGKLGILRWSAGHFFFLLYLITVAVIVGIFVCEIYYGSEVIPGIFKGILLFYSVFIVVCAGMFICLIVNKSN